MLQKSEASIRTGIPDPRAMRPTISRDEDWSRDAITYRLTVPSTWLVAERHWLAKLCWWMLRLLWEQVYHA